MEDLTDMAEAQKRRIAKEKADRLLAEEKSSTLHGGDKMEQIDLSDEYPVVEGKRRTPRAKEVESDEEKSPLND